LVGAITMMVRLIHQMATIYVQDVSAQTDKVIENSRKLIIQEKT
jgi:hypothetical protein